MIKIARFKKSEFLFRHKETKELYRGFNGKGTYNTRKGAEAYLNEYPSFKEDYEIVEFKLQEVVSEDFTTTRIDKGTELDSSAWDMIENVDRQGGSFSQSEIDNLKWR